MKVLYRTLLILLLMSTLILTACGRGNTDTTQTEDTATITDSELPAAESPVAEEEPEAEPEEDADEEGQVEVSLFDRALLESIKFNVPDTMTMVSIEKSNDEETIVTTYQKGYSTREERVSDGETSVMIYNAEEGISYDYIVGETEGFLWKDSEEAMAELEENRDMEGRSLLSLIEEDLEEDLIIKAKRIRMLGRNAVEISIAAANPETEEDAVPWVIVFDEKYTVGLRSEMSFGEEWHYSMEATKVEFNKKLSDDLFKPPEDMVFSEY